MNKCFYLVAGEASGDILGARLIRELKNYFPKATFSGIGGPLMMAEGFQSLYPMERLSIMGIVPILKRLPGLLKMRNDLAKHIIEQNPDCFIGIDAPVFNTGLEFRLKHRGIKTVHYVSPSVWAWRENRIHKIAKSVSLMLCLFPFELEIYQRFNVPAVCIGHPLANEIPLSPNTTQARQALKIKPDNLTLAILPGSRGTEVKFLLQPFIETAQNLLQHYPKLQILIPCANYKRRTQIENYLTQLPEAMPVTLIDGQSRLVMQAADLVLLASGTATLEAMLLKKPMIVAYKVSAFSYWVFKKLLKIKQFSLPNLLAGKAIVREFIQQDCTAEKLTEASINLIENKNNLSLEKEYIELHQTLKLGGSQKAAKAIVDLIAH
ncbi:lipid-A-disaccharide synthase [Aliikangiella maris]|uniref:Lipid-A-disaccharide synthase n=2 Tax=Aliikangiella maris TaxID=3162458 RepID=A0ABV3MMQ6_9GAMM